MRNTNNKKLRVFGIILYATACTTIHAQTVVNGFFPKQNDLTTAISYGYKSNSKFFRGTTLGTNPAMLGDIEATIINLYTEYGITDWLSATATLPYIAVKSADGQPDPIHMTDQVEGLQDLGLYLKGKIYEVNTNNNATFKLGSTIGLSFPISDYEGAGVLSIGNSATDFNATIISQYMLSFGLFAEIQGGYSVRDSNDFTIPNATLFTGKLGYAGKYFYADTILGIQNSQSGLDIGTPEFAAAGGPAALPETDVDYTQITFNVYVPFYKNMLGASAGYTKTVKGRNFNDASGFSLGLVYSMK